MSILDTFYILFKTDADEAAKDIKEVDKASDDAEKGLRKVDDAAGKLGSSFVNMGKALVAPLLALASFGTIANIAIERAGAIRELDQFSVKLNASISDVDAFQRAVKGIGGETAGALDSLVKIGEKINEAFSDKDSGARKDFKEWGLAFKDAKGNALGASDGILALAKNLEKVSNAEALARIKKLGIEDAATIDFLMMGRMAVDEHIQAQKRMGVVTEEQAAATRDYYSALGDVQNLMTSIGNRIVGAFLPAATRVIEAFQSLVDWMLRHQTLVEGFFIGIAGVITAVYLPAITAAAVATLAALWPFIAVGAAIAAVGVAFALAYEDVVAFLNGQPSLIGALADKYEWFASIIEGIGQAYKALKAGGVDAIDGLAAAWGSIVDAAGKTWDAVSDFAGKFKGQWEALKELVSALGELFSAIGDRVAQDVTPVLQQMGEKFDEIKRAAGEMFDAFMADIQPITDAVNEAAGAIKSGFTGAFNAVMDVWNATIGLIADKISAIAGAVRNLAATIRGTGDAAPTAANDNAASAGSTIGAMMSGQRALANASGAPISGQTAATVAGGGVVSNTSNVTVGSVTVNTQATDAAGVAGAVRGELQRQLRGTAAQFDDGVDR